MSGFYDPDVYDATEELSEFQALYGDCFGGAFEDTSSEMVWVARPPG